jgi:hypothetical protein
LRHCLTHGFYSLSRRYASICNRRINQGYGLIANLFYRTFSGLFIRNRLSMMLENIVKNSGDTSERSAYYRNRASALSYHIRSGNLSLRRLYGRLAGARPCIVNRAG